MVEVFDRPYATLIIDSQHYILYQKWKGYLNVEDFKAVIDFSVKCFEEYSPLHYILSDTSEQAVLATEGSDYAASVMPKLLALGLKKIAFVIPKSAFTQLSVDQFSRSTEKSIVQHFDTKEQAVHWLLSQ